MLILAFDTTAVTASVALLDNETVIASSSVHNKLTHSEKILPMADQMLKNSGYTIDDVELIGVSEGPGSFTGVRIGIATAKGLAFEKNLPIGAVSALEALAWNIVLFTETDFSQGIIVAPCMDARRDELYNALFYYDGHTLSRMTEDRPISCSELIAELDGHSERIVINGDGAQKLYSYIADNALGLNAVMAPELTLRQNAVSVGKLAYRKYLSGETNDVLKISPLYLRTSQAERVNNKGETK